MATECPRCAAERRAARRAARLDDAKVALVVVAFAAVWVAMLAHGGYPPPVGPRWGGRFLLLAATLAVAATVSGTLALRAERRAVVSLSAPPADPLATYREGGAPECARHPFAR